MLVKYQELWKVRILFILLFKCLWSKTCYPNFLLWNYSQKSWLSFQWSVTEKEQLIQTQVCQAKKYVHLIKSHFNMLSFYVLGYQLSYGK